MESRGVSAFFCCGKQEEKCLDIYSSSQSEHGKGFDDLQSQLYQQITYEISCSFIIFLHVYEDHFKQGFDDNISNYKIPLKQISDMCELTQKNPCLG